VCSAYVHESGLRQRLQAGQYAVLPKPFTALELRETVARALTEPRALANPERAHPAA
jgi:CheY-like chemotaxis protein